MNQERWKELVQHEARSTQWQFAAGVFAVASLVLMLLSMATGRGDPWLLAGCSAIGVVLWMFERQTHRETLRTLEGMAGFAAGRGGIEA